jgi:cytochrome P450
MKSVNAESAMRSRKIAGGGRISRRHSLITISVCAEPASTRRQTPAEATRELDGPAETLLDRLVETRAVVEEALRLYPPLAAISRVARSSDELAATPIRRGAMVVIAPYVLHRHRLWWEEPELFNPARFLPPSRARLCLHALRGRVACLRRLGVCLARGDDRRRGHYPRVRT